MTPLRSSSSNFLVLAALALLGFAMLLGGCRSYPACKNDGHCVNYERGTPFCVDRICRECRDTADCGFCEQCSGNQCLAIPGCCGSDSDCPDPMVCRDERCGPQCLSDDDCGDLERCAGGECTEVECRTDDDCEEGLRCENYECAPIPDTTPCANRQFPPIYFDFDEYTLRADQQAVAGDNLACLERFPESVDVEGHCDERGTVEYNLALGERRARTVRNWLEDQGIDRSRMNKISYGESRPAASGSSSNAHRQNRRVQLTWQ